MMPPPDPSEKKGLPIRDILLMGLPGFERFPWRKPLIFLANRILKKLGKVLTFARPLLGLTYWETPNRRVGF